MMKTVINTCNNERDAYDANGKTKAKRLFRVLLSRSNVVLYIAAFIAGRGRLPGGLMPFGTALYAAAWGLKGSTILTALFAIMGMATNGAKEQVYIAASTMLIFSALNLPFKRNGLGRDFRQAATAFASAIIPGIIATCLQGFLLYDLLTSLLYAFIVFLLVFVFRNAFNVVEAVWQKYACSSEDVISVAILALIMLMGFGEIRVLGFGIKNIVGILIILVLSHGWGTGSGTAAGAVAGLTISMSSDFTPLLIGSYAFCGLLAGVFRGLGRVGSSFGFIMGNAVLTLYLNGSTDILIYLKDILAAVCIFLLIPKKLFDAAGAVFYPNGVDMPKDKKAYSTRIREITAEKLNRFSQAFKALAKTLSEVSQTRVVADKNDISCLLDRVADRICKDCGLCLYCWDRNFYSTYQVMFRVVEKLDAKGRVEEKDIPAYFMERCERLDNFIREVNSIYEISKVDMMWKNRMGESRELISQQLEGLSKAVSDLASEINSDVHFNSDLEADILRELNRAGVRATEVIVRENRHKRYEISILHKGCSGRRVCISVIRKVVSDMVGRKMLKDERDCCRMSDTGKCLLKLIEEEIYHVITGVARMTKHEEQVSGDSYTFMNNGDGKFVLGLSDGMGSGQKALMQSKTTISLLEQFMESGFDKDMAVNLVNSMLALKSDNDAFSTVDLSILDLYTGEVEFVKVGAAPTFIKKEERIETVKSATIPAGILSNIEMELAHKKLNDGDFIVMVTDGILEAMKKGPNGGDDAITKHLARLTCINPQEIADGILKEACKCCAGRPADDMTVLVAKVWRRSHV